MENEWQSILISYSKEQLVMKQRVGIRGELDANIKGRQEFKDSASSGDLKGDYIGMPRRYILEGEQAIRTILYEGQAELRMEQ